MGSYIQDGLLAMGEGDGPLWLERATSQKLELFVRLGGFHTLMSFAIFFYYYYFCNYWRNYARLEYRDSPCDHGKKTVIRMFFGNAISRTITGHFLAEASLRLKLLDMIFPERGCDVHASSEDQQQEVHEINIPIINITNSQDENELSEQYDKLCNHIIKEEDVENSSVLKNVENSLNGVCSIGRTI